MNWLFDKKLLKQCVIQITDYIIMFLKIELKHIQIIIVQKNIGNTELDR